MSRRVRLVLCSRAGELLGSLPEFAVGTPWWPDVEPVVEAAREGFGIDVVVLRLLTADADPAVMGGAVRYLAELVGEMPSELALGSANADDAPEDHALRAPWARPGGVATTTAWADAVLAATDRTRTGRPVQVKSWNLSSILRLPTTRGDVWCKSVPPFLAHEGAILAMVGAENPSLVPPLLGGGREAGTMLLANVAGEDQWNPPESRLVDMVRKLVQLQGRWAGRVGELLAAGLPDWRARSMPTLVRTLLRRTAVRAHFTSAELAAIDALAADLPPRLAALAGCGLPETLVHGDFHPGNWRFDGDALVLLDWGDSGVGHPMLDLAAFLPRVPEAVRPRVRAAWLDAWRAERPLADPSRAAELIAPVAALRLALTYQRFLDGIKPSQWRYHEADVRFWLRRALDDSAKAAGRVL
jgi:hypothetical protein